MERARIRAAESAVAEVLGDREGLRDPLDILVLRVLEGYKDRWDSRDQPGQRDRWDHRGLWARQEPRDQPGLPAQQVLPEQREQPAQQGQRVHRVQRE